MDLWNLMFDREKANGEKFNSSAFFYTDDEGNVRFMGGPSQGGGGGAGSSSNSGEVSKVASRAGFNSDREFIEQSILQLQQANQSDRNMAVGWLKANIETLSSTIQQLKKVPQSQNDRGRQILVDAQRDVDVWQSILDTASEQGII